ncbi:MAG: hypothetical protein QOK05_2755 [Chloroflexota bacterium]|nr:hypothetical protein [Chloroflexota bacterium]
MVIFAIVGLVASAYISSHRQVDQPGIVTSPFPGTDPPDGDTAAGGQGQPVGGITCDHGEQLAFHTHAHLYILRDGFSQPVAANVGIPGGSLLPKCIYWLHTHDRTGVIHMEAPVQRAFTLGDFFDIWGQPLSLTEVALNQVPAGTQLAVTVDGQPFTGDPRSIPLRAHTQVVIQLGKQVKPPSFDFGSL